MHDVRGIGLGLRMELARDLLEAKPTNVDWLEIHPENYIQRGGRYATVLKQASSQWPLVTHGLTMGFGCTTPFERDYLHTLRDFLSDTGTPWHSDHLCFPGVGDTFVHDLLPLPLNGESVRTVSQRLNEARDVLGVPLAVENVSYYAATDQDEMDEATFVAEVLKEADAKLLLDVNNVFVNSQNHGFDPQAWIEKIPGDKVVQIHVAGHLVREDGFRIDTHGEDVPDPVFDLLAFTLERIGDKPILLERDGNFPPLESLLSEVDQLHAIAEAARTTRNASTTETRPAP